MNDPEEPRDDVVTSRTQRKREALDLQKIGQRLLDLDPGDLATVPLAPEMVEAIDLYKRIRSHEARRRQLQFIGKLMRKTNTDSIEEALARIDGNSAQAKFRTHQLESWRERLIAEPRALTEYLDAHPEADRQALRHQISRVHKARDEAQHKTQARALFRLLKQFEGD